MLQLGLIIIKHLVVSLDSFLLLEAEFHLQESLMNQQNQCMIAPGEYILDDLFLLRNQILSSTFLIGGPQERSLPTLHLSKPIIFQFPLSNDFLPEINQQAYVQNSHISHQALSDFLDTLEESSMNKDKCILLQVFMLILYFRNCLCRVS